MARHQSTGSSALVLLLFDCFESIGSEQIPKSTFVLFDCYKAVLPFVAC